MAVVVGIIIGAGIFASPTVILQNSGSVGLSLIIWITCGILCTLCAFCYTELGLMINKGGGDFAFLKESYGLMAGFMWLVVTTFFIEPSSISMISLTLGHYVIETVDPTCLEDSKDSYAKLLACSSLSESLFNCVCIATFVFMLI